MTKVFKFVALLLGRGLLFLLSAYWAIVISKTVVKLVEGGPGRVAAWHGHIGTWIQASDGPAATFAIHEFRSRQFLTAQAICAAITMGSILFECRSSKKRVLKARE
jgi:hypothetical protein